MWHPRKEQLAPVGTRAKPSAVAPGGKVCAALAVV